MSLALSPTQDAVSALTNIALSGATPMSTLSILAVGLLAVVLALFIPILSTQSRLDEAQSQTMPETNISPTVYSSATAARKSS